MTAQSKIEIGTDPAQLQNKAIFSASSINQTKKMLQSRLQPAHSTDARAAPTCSKRFYLHSIITQQLRSTSRDHGGSQRSSSGEVPSKIALPSALAIPGIHSDASTPLSPPFFYICLSFHARASHVDGLGRQHAASVLRSFAETG